MGYDGCLKKLIIKQSERKHMYKKYHNMLQVFLAVSPLSGGLNKTTGDLKEEIKNFYVNDELFIGDKMLSKSLLKQIKSM
jgi:hypothetical protein